MGAREPMTIAAKWKAARTILGAGAALTAAFAGCDPAAQQDPPAAAPRETGRWLAYDVDVPGRDARDLVVSFETSAHGFGCQTEHLASQQVGLAGRGAAELWYGAKATCDEGTIALAAVGYTRVRVSCEVPTTRAECDALLRRVTGSQ